MILHGETCLKSSVRKALTATISKAVQVEYTAFGRHINGRGKRDFSKTCTYSCIKGLYTLKMYNFNYISVRYR